MSFESATHTDCLLQIEKGNERSLAMLMKQHYAGLFNYGCRFCEDKELVKDCIQEVFISLWNRRQTASTISSPSFYLLGAVKNQVLKMLKKNHHTVSLQKESAYDFHIDFPIETKIIDEQLSFEKRTKLQNALSSLSARQKEVIYLKFYRHADPGQIAGLMGISQQSVYNLLHETIRELRKDLQPELFLKAV